MASHTRVAYDVLTRPLAALARSFWLGVGRLHDRRTSKNAPSAHARTRHHGESTVDAVYTWVDLSDPEWRSRQRRRIAERQEDSRGVPDHRYLDRQELRYSLRSLDRYAPWVRHVWILTDGQTPPWLDTSNPRLTVVDHREVFPDSSVLPVFNSHAIETCLHRIDGLSRRFLYLNDDFFLGRTVRRSDFVGPHGSLRVRVRDSRGARSREAAAQDFMVANRRALGLIRNDVGPIPAAPMLDHVPHLLDRDVMNEVESLWPEFLRTRASPFRSPDDVAPVMLTLFYAVATGRGCTEKLGMRRSLHVSTGREDVGLRLLWLWLVRPTFYCLNSTTDQMIDLATQERLMHAYLATVLPEPSPFERGP